MISNRNWDGFSKNMAAINQHATVEKKRVNVCFKCISYSPYSWFGLNSRHMVMTQMYCEMQNKLSISRGSPLGSMGEIISSRCPCSFLPTFRHCTEEFLPIVGLCRTRFLVFVTPFRLKNDVTPSYAMIEVIWQ